MATEIVNHYLSNFAEHAAVEAGSSPAWLGEARQRAINQFADTGFPSSKDEKWRFTNFSRLSERRFAIRNGSAKQPTTLAVDTPVVGWWSDTRIVFVDGNFSPDLSSTNGLPDGVYAGSLSKALPADNTELERTLTTVADDTASPFTALNTAFFSEGGVLLVPDGVRIEKPVQFLYLTSEGVDNSALFARNLIVVGENAEATIVESYFGLGASRTWTNVVTELSIGDASNVKLHRVQQESTETFHTATTQVCQGRDSNVAFSTVDFGSSLSRHDIGFQLNGTGAFCSLHGLSYLRGRQHADNQTTIDHSKPHCSSNEQFTGIFDDDSHGVFTGRVLVRPDAQKTDAMQSSRNLLLSETARADTQPQLEIFADDVKCTHGSTVGPIDENALFYLRSKGLTAEDARTMLTYGFAAEIIETIGIAGLRDSLASQLKSRMVRDTRAA